MQRTVALIPARGNSKRIPRKNLINLLGKPLLSYAIEAALAANTDEVYVSSEDDEILKVAAQYGAIPILRDMSLSQDETTSEAVLLDFTARINFNTLVFIQATSPLISHNFLNSGISKIGEYDSVLSLTEDRRFYWSSDGKPYYDLLNRPRTQDMTPAFKETGSFYITTREALIASRCRVSGKIGMVVVPESDSFEIDTIEDFNLIELILRNKGIMESI